MESKKSLVQLYQGYVHILLDKALDDLDLTDDELKTMQHIVASEGLDTVKTLCNVIIKAKKWSKEECG